MFMNGEHRELFWKYENSQNYNNRWIKFNGPDEPAHALAGTNLTRTFAEQIKTSPNQPNRNKPGCPSSNKSTRPNPILTQVLTQLHPTRANWASRAG